MIPKNNIYLFIAIILTYLCNTTLPLGQEVKTYNAPGIQCYSNTLFINTSENPKGVIIIDICV